MTERHPDQEAAAPGGGASGGPQAGARRLLARLFVSLVIGGALLYLALYNIDLGRVGRELRDADWIWLVPYFVAMLVQHYYRAVRWCYLLEPIAHVPFRRILPISSVGFLAIVALPLRMGELVRPYLIADPPRLRVSHGLGTMAVERVFDGLVLSLLCFIAVAEAQRRTEVPYLVLASGWVSFLVFFGMLLASILALWKKHQAVELCRRLFGLISRRVGDRMASIAGGIVDGFQVLPHARHLTIFLVETLLYWLFNAVAVWILSYSFGLDLSFWAGTSVMVIVGIGIMVPAGPGFVGNFELFARSAMAMYVATGDATIEAKGMAYIFTFHATNALWYAVTGAIAMASPEVTMGKVWRASTAKAGEGGPHRGPLPEGEGGAGKP